METMYLEAASQIKALAHPMRLGILKALGASTMTNQQLAEALGQPPAKTHFHVLELSRAGLIVLAEQRPKGGVIEKYYRAAATHFQLGSSLDHQHDGAVVEATLAAARRPFVTGEAETSEDLGLQIVQDQATLNASEHADVMSYLQRIGDIMAAAHAAPRPSGKPTQVTCILHSCRSSAS